MAGFEDMWIAFAMGSAFFAGLAPVLAKVGLIDTDSTVATAMHAVVVLAMSWCLWRANLSKCTGCSLALSASA